MENKLNLDIIKATVAEFNDLVNAAKKQKIYPFFITGEINSEASWYEPLMKALTTLHQEEETNPIIEIHFNSYGGDTSIAVQLVHAINRCQIPVRAVVSGYCQSAASMIVFGSHFSSLIIDPLTNFLFHDSYNTNSGQSHDWLATIEQERKFINGVHRQYYSSVLTMEEIDAIMEGKELYMLGEEVLYRLENHQLTEEDKDKIIRITNATSFHKPLVWKEAKE